MLFSERHGYRDVRTAIQYESMDDPLRNCLWDVIITDALGPFHRPDNYTAKYDPHYPLLVAIWHMFFKKPIDTIPEASEEACNTLRTEFFEGPWYYAYDFVEFLIGPLGYEGDNFVRHINAVLEREKSAYRIVGKQVTPIADNIEISSIEEALEDAHRFRGATTHLQAALKFLSDRSSPDYRNSVKESISAVESVCQIITGSKRASLGDALVELEKHGSLHGALKKSFSAVYGYTSDAEGIRHAMSDQSTVTFEEAKYMLVTCSAFINYLVGATR